MGFAPVPPPPRRPKITFRWAKQRVADKDGKRQYEQRVFWSVTAANGEVICSSSQGSRDKNDAMRSVCAATRNFIALGKQVMEDVTEGPGPKPQD